MYDVLALVQPPPSSDGSNNLHPICDYHIQACMITSSTNIDHSLLVILDDITILEWIGFPLINIYNSLAILKGFANFMSGIIVPDII